MFSALNIELHMFVVNVFTLLLSQETHQSPNVKVLTYKLSIVSTKNNKIHEKELQ